MPVETQCSGCSRRLLIADEHIGKQVRCPDCNTICVLDGSSSAGADAPAAAWYMRTPEGQTYGPVSRPEIESWVSQGRVTADCRLREGEGDTWVTADQQFPSLGPPRPQSPSGIPPLGSPTAPTFQTSHPGSGHPGSGHPGSGQPGPWSEPATSSPYAASPYAVGGARGYLAPDRGGLVLTLAILGWLMCPMFSVAAWVMGSHDLREIRAGRMDPAGQGLTQAGQILGMIHSVLLIISAMFIMFILLFAAASGGNF